MDEATITDVTTESPAVEAPVSTDASSAPAAEQGESQTQSTAEQTAGEAAAPFQIPENDDDLKGQETNPHVQAIVQLRQELRARNQSLDAYKPLDDWKPIVETVGDPQLARSAYETVSALYTPSTENPSGFDPTPFLEKVEADQPGTVNQLFSTICAYRIQDEQGNPTTVVRELYKAHGLDPDRIDDYRNIDNLRASGVVNPDDLAKIPERYRDAFKSLSSASQEDILEIIGTKPLVAEEALRNAQDSLEARQYREESKRQQAEAAQQQEAELAQAVETAVTEGVNAKINQWTDSIHQSLSQWKPSTDEGVNDFERGKVISTIAALQVPAYRKYAEAALKHAGADLGNWDELVNQWTTSISAAITYEKMGQQGGWQAQQAASAAKLAEQRILIKLQDFAKSLSEPSSAHIANASQQQAAQLATAQGRFVPTNGNGGQQGVTNPYSQNPHPVGTQEYFAFNRKIDREYQMDNASVFSG